MKEEKEEEEDSEAQKYNSEEETDKNEKNGMGENRLTCHVPRSASPIKPAAGLMRAGR